MRHTCWMVMASVFFAMCMALTGFAQEVNKPAVPAVATPVANNDPGAKIFEEYKNCVVLIQTEIMLENGQKSGWLGSGFFTDKDGTVQTVAHVLKAPNDELQTQFFGPKVKIASYSYWVTLVDKGKKWKGELVCVNPYSDTGKLKILNADPRDYGVARIGDSDKVKVGEAVYAIGAPLGLTNTLTAGHVSAVHRFINFNYLEDFIQTDAPINAGNSGSPLINSDGEVVGINDAGVSGADGLAFAVSMNLAMKDSKRRSVVELPWFGLEALVLNFPRTGTYDHPRFKDVEYLNGITGNDDLEALVLLAKVTKDEWAIAYIVDESWVDELKSPAQKAGLKRGDLITKINGKPVKSGMDIRLAVLDIPIGQRFEIEYTRTDNGVELKSKTQLVLEKMPEAVAEQQRLRMNMRREAPRQDNTVKSTK